MIYCSFDLGCHSFFHEHVMIVSLHGVIHQRTPPRESGKLKTY
jgi:hypothetical protein